MLPQSTTTGTARPSFAECYASLTREYAGESLRPPAHHLRVAEILAERCPAGGAVADIGSYPGMLAGALARTGWRVRAVEKHPERSIVWQIGWSKEALLSGEAGTFRQDGAIAFTELCEREGIPCSRVDVEREALPFGDGELDAVVFTEIVEHLWLDPIFALREVNRVLRPEVGTLILTTPNLTAIRHRLSFLRGDVSRIIEHPFVSFLKRQRIGHVGHLRLYAPDEIASTLELLGFEPELSFGRLARGAARAAGGAAQTASRSRRGPGLLTKLVRTPRGYAEAAIATLVELGERRVPHLRPQIYVVARKRRDADFDRNFPEALRRLVYENTVAPSRTSRR